MNNSIYSGLILFGLLVTLGSTPSALGKNIPLALLPIEGKQSASAQQILSHEIKQSGVFYLAKPERGAFIAKGKFVKKGFQGQLLHPDGHKLFSRTYSTGTLKRDLRQFTDDLVFSVTKQPGIATSQVAFISSRSGKPDIYICDYDGKNVRQITRDGLPKRHPSLSPNGRFLFFTGNGQSSRGIYKIDLSNDRRTKITTSHGNASEKAVISPDGKQLALAITKNGNSDIYTARSSGKSLHRLTKSPNIELQPSWSADGKSLVYTAVIANGSTQLFIVNSKDANQPKPLPISLPSPSQANWSPDGHHIAFVSRASIAIHDLRNGTSRMITQGQSPVWGAGSRHLIYTNNGALYRINVATGEKTQILSASAKAYDPSWTR